MFRIVHSNDPDCTGCHVEIINSKPGLADRRRAVIRVHVCEKLHVKPKRGQKGGADRHVV